MDNYGEREEVMRVGKLGEQVLASRLKRPIAEYGKHDLGKGEVLRNAENILIAHVMQAARLGVRETALRMKKSPDVMPPELQKQLNGIVAEKLAEFKAILDDVRLRPAE
jgi:hypothetical protein